MINLNNVKFYSYNGFNKPQFLATGIKELEKNLIVESNYLGDLTDDTIEEIKEHVKMFDTIEEIQCHDENYINGVWINPTLKNLQNYNQYVGLDENSYLENFTA